MSAEKLESMEAKMQTSAELCLGKSLQPIGEDSIIEAGCDLLRLVSSCCPIWLPSEVKPLH